MRINKIILIVLVILIASAAHLTSVSANSATSNTTVLNAAPTVDIGLVPDNDPAASGVQVINPDWEFHNRTVMITATVSDMNGWDDLTGIVTAVITGLDPVDDSHVSLTFDHNTSVAIAVYTGVFNMSAHAEGDYTVEVTADDAGGLSGTGSENFTYLHTADDITPPTVTDPAADPDSITADGAEESELSVNVADASEIYAVTIDLSPIGGDSAQPMTKITGTDIYTTTTTAAVGTTPGMYGLPVTATDNSPNRNTNTDVNILLTVLPQEAVTTYDFTTGAGSDRWAYGPQCKMNPPPNNDVPDKVFKSKQYEMITADDRIMMVSRTFRRFFYAAHRFDFIIAEPENGIREVDILWNGTGDHDLGIDGAALYIWNFETQSYEYLDSSTNVYTTLKGSINTDIGDYIGPGGHLIILAEQNGPHLKFWRWTYRSRLGTDCVKVDVTYTPQPETLLDITSGPNNVMEVER